MSIVSKRYLELLFRKESLESIIKKTEEELNKKAIIMLAKSMDGDLEEKLAGSLAMMKKWLQEITDDVEALEEKLVEEIEKEWKDRVDKQMEENKDK